MTFISSAFSRSARRAGHFFAWTWAVLAPCLPGAGAAEELPYRWQTVALGGGGFVTGVIFHPTQPGLVYARTDVGGAFRWEAAEQRWVALNDDLGRRDAQLTGISSLALDPQDPDRVYLAAGQYLPSWGRNAALLRSRDRGATWERTELPFRLGGNADGRSTGERLQVDPHDGRILWLGTQQDGLWRSVDHGVTWSRVAAFTPSAVTFVLLDEATGAGGGGATTIYVGTAGESTNLWRTTDGGATWAAIPGQPANLIPHHAAVDYRDDGKLYLAYSDGLGPNGVTSGAVWKFDAVSDLWTQLAVPTGQGGFSGLSLDPQRAGVLLVSTQNRWATGDEIYRSTDGGATWRPLLADATFERLNAPWSVARTPHWIGDVDLDPHDSTRAFFVTGYGLWATSSLDAADTGGQPTWEFRNEELEETVPLKLATLPTGAPLLAAYGDIGLFRHADLRTSPPLSDYFATHRTTTTSVAVAAADPRVIVRVHADAALGSYSRDGGSTFTDFPSLPPTAANGPGQIAVSADGSRFLWMPERSGAYTSADSGATWSASTGSPGGGDRSYEPVADAVDAQTFLIHESASGRLHVSRDGGRTFTSGAVVPSGGGPARAAPGHAGHFWIPTDEGGLYRSTDYGVTARQVAGPSAAWRVGLGRGAEEDAYPALYVWGEVAGAEGIFRSDDEGATWHRINDDAHRYGWINDVIGCAQQHGRVFLATGGRGVVYGEPAGATAELPSYGWAVMTHGQTSSYALPSLPDGATWSAAALPAGVTLDMPNGLLTGTPTDAPGTFHAVTLQVSGSGQSWPIHLQVAAPGDDVGLANLSSRAVVGTGEDLLIVGANLSGATARPVLLRAAGPVLAELGLPTAAVLAQPHLRLMRHTTPLGENTGWTSDTALTPSLRETMAQVGAFAWPEPSRDAALLPQLEPGPYTAQVSGSEGSTGIVLAEVYDAGGDGRRVLTNLSTRARVGKGDDILIGGLVLQGGGSRRLLVRAVGPGLVPHGVTGVLEDPLLTVYRGDTVLARNDNWSSRAADRAATEDAMAQAGAFALARGSLDAALVVQLVAGNYTLHVGGRDDGTGVALLEVYVLL